jgi:hypothetical protein
MPALQLLERHFIGLIDNEGQVVCIVVLLVRHVVVVPTTVSTRPIHDSAEIVGE